MEHTVDNVCGTSDHMFSIDNVYTGDRRKG